MLHLATMYGHTAMVRLLVETLSHGKPGESSLPDPAISARMRSGVTALHLAALYNRELAAGVLLEHGAPLLA